MNECQGCKYYLPVKAGFCGLGLFCQDQKDCEWKEKGEAESVELKQVYPIDYIPKFGLEQAPKGMQGVISYRRKHHKVKDHPHLREVTIEVVLNNKDTIYMSAKAINPLASARTINRDNYTTLILVWWTESKKEAFKAKKAKKGRSVK